VIVDFEKAYDKVNWDFLLECIRARVFCDEWCTWIRKVISGGSGSVKLNDKVGPYKSYKGGLGRVIHYPQFYSTLLLIASPGWWSRAKTMVCSKV
jgi:hypothetical protein